ncbi:Astacin (Peptidase family M12A) [compost metagenome]
MHLCTFDLRNQSQIYNNTNNTTSKVGSTIKSWTGWENGQTIRIKFLDGDTEDHEIVKRIATEWTRYANLKFEFVPATEYADIRIAILQGTGAWSDLGKSSTASNYQNSPTMRLGRPSKSYNEESARRTILHEFGHALGLHHETTNPSSDIKWKYPDVYKYFFSFSKEYIDSFVINKQNSEYTNYSKYDPLSIMHYYIPASITLDGKGVNDMSELSEIDKRFMQKMYPHPIKSSLYSGERLDSANMLTSPDDNYRLFIKSEGVTRSLAMYDYINFNEVMNIQPNIKLSNMTSGNVYLEIRGNSLLLFKGSVSKTIFNHPNPTLVIDHITLTDTGKINIISNGYIIASLNYF